MKKEDLIAKWLDHNLDEKELQAFKKLDASSAFMKIDQAAKQFKAPIFDIDENLNKILASKPSLKRSNSWLKLAGSIAAAVVISLGLYFNLFNAPNETTFFAHNTELFEFNLPDASEVFLNADSEISIDEKSWENSRTLTLTGEAYFKVRKGSTFTVHTDQGTVQVLGTQFTVKARPNFFQVICYEGRVKVTRQDNSKAITAGQELRFYNNTSSISTTNLLEPTWIHAKSSFESMPFSEVVAEIQRQYDVDVRFDETMSHTLFTGSFTNENLETALQAITIPLNLSFDIRGNEVVLKSN